MSAIGPRSDSSQSSSGYEDGLGRRVLAFDRESGTMLERLALRPELCAFEKALKERLAIVAGLDDERFAKPRTIEHLVSGALIVISEFVGGRRLSDIIDGAAEHGIVAGLDAGLGLLLELLPAIARLHDAGLAHGAIAPGRIMITPAGQILLLDAIYAEPLERLLLTRKRLWTELRLAFPATAGAARFDKIADLSQAVMVAASLIVGRPMRDDEYPDGIGALRQEIVEIASIRGTKAFADSVDTFFAPLLPVAGKKPKISADEAAIDLRKLLRKEVGINACRTALTEFFQQVEAADAERLAAETAQRDARIKQEVEQFAQAQAEAERLAKDKAEADRLGRERAEAERIAREKSDLRAREEAERQAREDAERRAREEAERTAREKAEAERKVREKAEAERKAREVAERKAREEAERKAREEAARIAREKAEAERRAREEAERKAREEAERKAREEAERKAREEAARIAREKAEAERRAREEAERKAREEAERKAREEAERKAREEAARIAREKAEAERRAREEAERKAREEAERKAREEAERKAREEAERKERERLEAERIAREKAETERRERERAERERLAKEARERAEQARLEVERLERERLDAERAERERATQAARERAERERVEAERLEREARERAEEEARERAERERLEHDRVARERLIREEAERNERLDQERRAAEAAAAERAARPGTPAPAQPSGGWLINPKHAAAFEPTAPEPPAPAAPPAAAKPYPIYVPPAEPAAWTADAPAETKPALEITSFAAPSRPPADHQATPLPSPSLKLKDAGGIKLKDAGAIKLKDAAPVPEESPTRALLRNEPEQISAAGAYAPGAIARPEREVPWKLIAAGIVLIAMTFAITRGYTPSAVAPMLATVKKAAPEDGAKHPAPAAITPGEIDVKTDPAGLKVLLDGRAAGESPVTLKNIPAGRHVVTLIGDGGTLKRTVRVPPGAGVTVDVTVFSGFVKISAPFVIEIAENEKVIGTSDDAVILGPGHHKLYLSNKDLDYAATQDVEVQPGETTQLTLDPRGRANINAVPWAEVWIDGEKAGETPMAHVPIRLGVREIVFKNPQFPDRKVVQTIKAGTEETIAVDFTKDK